MIDPNLIKNLEDLRSYINWIRSLRPKSTKDPEYMILRRFKYFSPEKIANKISLNKIQTSRWINKVKSEIWKRANRVQIVESMNREVPKIGEEISYWNMYTPGDSSGKKYYSSNCICLKDFKSSGTDRYFFYGGAIYQYTKIDYNGKYLIVWRSKPDQRRLTATRTYNIIIDPQEFESNFKDLRDYKIESILN